MPAAKVKVTKPKGYLEKDARLPYSSQTLNAILRSPLYAGCKSATRRRSVGTEIIQDDYFWVPLVAMFSGMRLGEIVQLQRRDIVQVDGVWVMDINRGDEGKNQIKTESSVRKVPIHAELLKLGLLEYISGTTPTDRIFGQIKPGNDGYFSHNFSKWWGQYMKGTNLAMPKTSFHSCRHSFKDMLTNAKVSDAVSHAICGHDEGTVHSNYGSKPPVKLMKEELDKVVFPLPFDKNGPLPATPSP